MKIKPLPKTEKTLLVRTDFSDDAIWEKIRSVVLLPGPEFQEALGILAGINAEAGQPLGVIETNLHIVDDQDYRNATTEQLLKLLDDGEGKILMFIVDQLAVSHSENPVLVIDLCFEPGRSFRALPSQVFSIESNLSIANMDWEDFADAIDGEGIFRG